MACCPFCKAGCQEREEPAGAACPLGEAENLLIYFIDRRWCRFTLPMERDGTRSPKASWQPWEIENFNQSVLAALVRAAPTRREAGAPGSATAQAIRGKEFIAELDEVVFPGDFACPGLILAGVSLRKTQFWGDVDFSGCRFEGDVDFSTALFKGKVNFSGASFAARANFSHCTFESGANWAGAQFDSDAEFTGASFNEFADFSAINIAESALFEDCRFHGDAGFLEARFGHSQRGLLGQAAPWRMSGYIAEFAKAKFDGNVMFGNARFFCDTDFAQATFKGQVYFKRASFATAVSFDRTRFEANAPFNQMVVRGRLLFKPDKISDPDFTAADFRGADLSGVALAGAVVQDAVFRDADLHDANLADVRHVLADQFAGTDVTGAKLPADIAKFSALAYVEDASRYARNMFMVLLAACAYAWLTIATTRDPALVLNTGSSPLPILNAKVPIAGFFIAAPVLLLLIYVYFVLANQRLFDVLSRLPAYFPDGRPAHQHTHPWLINGLLRQYFPRLAAARPLHAHVEYWITLLLLWGLVPLTVAAFWLRYLTRQDWLGTSVHVLLMSVTAFVAYTAARLARRTLQGDAGPAWSWRSSLRTAQAYRQLGLLIMFVVLGGLMSAGVIYGAPQEEYDTPWARRALPSALESVFRYRAFPAFRAGERPAISVNGEMTGGVTRLSRMRLRYLDARGVDLRDVDLRFSDLTGARLRGANLRGANLAHAVLYKADLSDALLAGANLEYADLRQTAGVSVSMLRKARSGEFAYWDEHMLKRLGLSPSHNENIRERRWIKARLPRANLTGTDLSGFVLTEARLTHATLSSANLAGVNLSWANLAGADLTGANLTGAKLNGTRLTDATMKAAVLSNADLGGADLKGADLEGAELEDARFYHPHPGYAQMQGINLNKAYLEAASLEHLDLTEARFIDAVLTRANLSYARLTNADFTGADLRGADLTGAELSGARFAGATLTESRGLTSDQLAGSCVDAETTLPAGIHRPRPCEVP